MSLSKTKVERLISHNDSASQHRSVSAVELISRSHLNLSSINAMVFSCLVPIIGLYFIRSDADRRANAAMTIHRLSIAEVVSEIHFIF